MKYTIVVGDWISASKHIDDSSIDLVVTSPPYIDMRGKFDISYDDYLSHMDVYLNEIYRVLKPGRVLALNLPAWYNFGGRHAIGFDVLQIARQAFELYESIIWKKKGELVTAGSGKRFGNFIARPLPFYYRPNNVYEFIFVLTKGKMKKPRRNSITEASRVYGEVFSSDVWEMAAVREKEHSSVFPLKLPETIIKLYSLAGETVLDPFCGSGTTMLAAKRTSRNCICVELCEQYVPLIKRKVRWNENSLTMDVVYEEKWLK